MRSETAKVMGLRDWVMLIALSVLWGGAFFFSKIAVAEMRPFTVVLGRVSIAALTLQLVVRLVGEKMPTSPRLWGQFALMGLLNNLLPFSLIFWGQTRIASGLASTLNAATPLWTVLLAHFLTSDERLTLNRLGGVVFGLIGVVTMIGPDVREGLGLNALAQVAVVGAGISYAFAGIYGKRFKTISPYVMAAGQVTCASMMMIPIVLLVDRPWLQPGPSLKTWGAVVALALLSTALAYLIYFRLLFTVGATNVLLVTLLVPVSATFLGMSILGERLDPRHFAGMLLIGLGLVVIDGRLTRAAWARLRWGESS
jgi:drug/metabolite transporter (DMT)-like permease